MASPLLIRQFQPAIELQCLCLFAGVPYVVESVAYPYVDSTGELPQVIDGGVLVGGEAALEYVRLKCALERPESGAQAALQCAHARGLLPLVQGTLGDVARWCAASPGAGAMGMFEAISRTTPLPFGPMLARLFRASTDARLHRQGMVDEASVQAKAQAAYAILQAMLAAEVEGGSGGPYFFGSRPSSLDAAVFAHLAAVRHRQAGQWVLSAAPALVRFYSVVAERHFGGRQGSWGGLQPNLQCDALAEQRAEGEGKGSGEVAFALSPPPPAQEASQGQTWEQQLVQVRNLVATAAIFAAAAYLVTAALKRQA